MSEIELSDAPASGGSELDEDDRLKPAFVRAQAEREARQVQQLSVFKCAGIFCRIVFRQDGFSFRSVDGFDGFAHSITFSGCPGKGSPDGYMPLIKRR